MYIVLYKMELFEHKPHLYKILEKVCHKIGKKLKIKNDITLSSKRKTSY